MSHYYDDGYFEFDEYVDTEMLTEAAEYDSDAPDPKCWECYDLGTIYQQHEGIIGYEPIDCSACYARREA